MKRYLIIVLMVVMMLFAVSVSAVTCLWDAPTSGGTPTGYVLEWTDGVTVNTKTVIGATQTVIEDKYFEMSKPYTFVVYAYNGAGRSANSNSIVWTRLPFVPPNDSILVVKLDVPNVPSNARMQ